MNQRANGATPKNAQAIYNRSVVQQAVGMISVQLAVPIPVAMKRLQDYAAEHGRTRADVVADIVARRLIFDADGMD
ncbi:ANTAR domain-containing protein [Catenulispora rubra]|uniref:ANTAR domain-containing protein n=1 Tax=Catenulispora rubra TaxID=280293 RepID=UPI00189203B3|nr:ANTAR domain-containing protein [Catenulispora rubra]